MDLQSGFVPVKSGWAVKGDANKKGSSRNIGVGAKASVRPVWFQVNRIFATENTEEHGGHRDTRLIPSTSLAAPKFKMAAPMISPVS